MLRVYECIQDPNGSISSTCYCPRDQLGDTVRDLIFIISLAFALNGVHADLLVVLLEGSEIFASLGEFTFLHTLTDVPVDESALRVHQVKLVIQTSPSLGDGSGVGQHADSAGDLSQVTTRNNSRGLIVDTDLKRTIEITMLPFQVTFAVHFYFYLETSRAPVDELDCTLGLDSCNCGIDILRDNISAVQHAASHVLAVTWVAFDHLVGRLEASIGDFSNSQLFVVSLLRRNNWSVGD